MSFNNSSMFPRHAARPASAPAPDQIVVTDSVHVANQASVHFGQYALLVGDIDFSTWPADRSLTAMVDELVAQAALFAQDKGLWAGQGTGARVDAVIGA